MISVKSEIYTKLSQELQALNVTVYDYHPADLTPLPLVVCLEENNIPHEIIDNKEVTSEMTFRIDVWSADSTTEIVLMINSFFEKFGAKRVLCSDLIEKTGMKHKLLKFKGIIDCRTMLVYSNN